MAPLSHLSYPTAFAFFTALSIVLGCLVVTMLDGVESHLFGESSHCFGWWLLGWPIAIETILGGQQSLMGLAIGCRSYPSSSKKSHCLGRRHSRPRMLQTQSADVFALVVIIRYPRMIGGLACTAMATLVLQILAVGPECIGNYIVLAGQLATESWGLETPSVKVHGLAPVLAHGGAQGYERKILLVLGILGCVAWAWCDRRIQGDKLAQAVSWSCIVIWNAFCNPDLPVYDLLLLAIPTLLLLRVGHEHRLATPWCVVLLGAITLGPHFSQAVAARTGIQLFPAFLASIGLVVACFLGNRSLGSVSSTAALRIALAAEKGEKLTPRGGWAIFVVWDPVGICQSFSWSDSTRSFLPPLTRLENETSAKTLRYDSEHVSLEQVVSMHRWLRVPFVQGIASLLVSTTAWLVIACPVIAARCLRAPHGLAM
jgi:hypothetical protein